MEITDGDLALFRERARTELKSGCDVTRLAWDAVVPALCDEVTKLRRKLAVAASAGQYRAEEKPEPQKPQEPKKE